MRGSAKGDEPDTLRTWKADQRAVGIDLHYAELSRVALQATRQALYLEQTGQCVYCGRAIELEARTRHHVEHFRPRSRYPDRELAYANLFLSCGPQQPQAIPNRPAATRRRPGSTRRATSSPRRRTRARVGSRSHPTAASEATAPSKRIA